MPYQMIRVKLGLIYTAEMRLHLRSIFLTIAVSAELAGPACGAQDMSGKRLTADEIKALETKAIAGDVDAELKVARAYSTGEGVAKDSALAVRWYQEAAQRGSAVAQTTLGLAYRSGDGVTQDKAKAVDWFKRAARQNYPNALFNLGTAYYNGEGVEISDATAYGWFLLAREAGSQNAIEAVQRAEEELKPEILVAGLKEIARNYERGDLLPRNEAIALKWWIEAAKKDDEDARIAVANKYLDGRVVAQDLSQAKTWCEEAVKATEAHGDADPRAYYCMGFISEYQRDADLKKARDWYEKAYKLRSAQGTKALARMYAMGEGGKVDRQEAWLLYFALARSGDNSVKPPLIKLRSEMNKKEWDDVIKRLSAMHVAPETVDQWLGLESVKK
jgi:uncharacterized protein